MKSQPNNPLQQKDTNQKFQMLIDYIYQYPDITLWYYTSDMILICEADSVYLVLPKYRSRSTVWFVLRNYPNKHDNFIQNAPIYMMCLTFKNTIASAAECKTGGIFMTVQHACPIRVTLIRLGHPKQPTVNPL